MHANLNFLLFQKFISLTPGWIALPDELRTLWRNQAGFLERPNSKFE